MSAVRLKELHNLDPPLLLLPPPLPPPSPLVNVGMSQSCWNRLLQTRQANTADWFDSPWWLAASQCECVCVRRLNAPMTSSSQVSYSFTHISKTFMSGLLKNFLFFSWEKKPLSLDFWILTPQQLSFLQYQVFHFCLSLCAISSSRAGCKSLIQPQISATTEA